MLFHISKQPLAQALLLLRIMNQKHEQKTKGTVIAERIRSKTNQLSDEERERLVQKARKLMHGGGGQDKACAHRR